MIKEFYLGILNENEKSFYLKHIQYNILKRISTLKEISYKRIDLNISPQDGDSVEFDDKRRIQVKIGIQSFILDSITEADSIKEIYFTVFRGLKMIFEKDSIYPQNNFL